MPPSTTTSARTWQLTAAIAASVTVLAAAAYFLFRAGPEEEEEESAPPAASQRSGGGAGSAAAAAAAAGPASGSGASSSSGSSASSGSSVSSAKGAAAVGASGMTRERLLEYLRDLIRAYTKLDEENRVESAQLKSEMGEERASNVMAAKMKEQMEAITKTLEGRYKVDESTIMTAMNEHSEDQEVHEEAQTLQRLLLGDEHVDELKRMISMVPEDLTVDSFLGNLKRHNEVIMRRFQAVYARASKDVGKGKSLQDKMGYLQLLMGRDQDALKAETEEALGFSEEVFMGALQKFNTDGRVQEQMQTFQMTMQMMQMQYQQY